MYLIFCNKIDSFIRNLCNKMDDVIFSRILLACNYDTFMNVSKICKKANKVAKIVWKQWISMHLKIREKMLKLGFGAPTEIYEYYNGKNGKHVLHGIYKFPNNNDSDNVILKYKHNKLHGECLYQRGFRMIRADYVKGSLNGSYILSNLSGQIKSARFYNKGRKCCSIRNDYDHFCPIHYDEGMKLMGWKERKKFQNI